MSIRKPTRQCVACKTCGDKSLFFRLVRPADNKSEIIFDESRQGRSAYLCKNLGCIEKAVKKNIIGKHLKANMDMSVYDELRGKINGNK